MSEAVVPYPVEVPVESVRQIVRIVSGGQLHAERSSFAKHAWIVQGFLQRQLLGDPAFPTPALAGPERSFDDAGMCRLLEASAGVATAGPFAMSAVGATPVVATPIAAFPIPVQLLVRWLIEKLLERLDAG